MRLTHLRPPFFALDLLDWIHETKSKMTTEQLKELKARIEALRGYL